MTTPATTTAAECDGPDVTKAAQCFQEFTDLYQRFFDAEERVLLTGMGKADQTRLAYQIEDALYTWRRQFAAVPGNMAYELKVAALNAVREARAVKAP